MLHKVEWAMVLQIFHNYNMFADFWTEQTFFEMPYVTHPRMENLFIRFSINNCHNDLLFCKKKVCNLNLRGQWRLKGWHESRRYIYNIEKRIHDMVLDKEIPIKVARLCRNKKSKMDHRWGFLTRDQSSSYYTTTFRMISPSSLYTVCENGNPKPYALGWPGWF